MDSLLYVDPSPRGEWALHLASLLPARIVEGWVLLATADDDAADPGLLARARARLSGDIAAHFKTAPGPAEVAVVKEAAANPYRLVVVPPAGRNAIQRMLRGSRVATVVRSVPAEVLVARRPPARIERVLAAVSGGPLTGDVVRRSLQVADALGARVDFLHVACEVALPYRPHGGEEHAPAVGDTTGSAARVRAVLQQAGHAGELLVQEGLVVDEVLSEMEQGAHHLLVVGAGAADRSWATEDVAERILVHCPASVLVVKGERR
jgi:nucleotide-binding universal stress UspA family protein